MKGISILFSAKEKEDRQSILAKKQALEQMLKTYPRFRAGILNLAFTWLQLHRATEALETLICLQKIDNSDPEIHYYLSILYIKCCDYPQAWHHLQQAEFITKSHHYAPKPLLELRRQLLNDYPE